MKTAFVMKRAIAPLVVIGLSLLLCGGLLLAEDVQITGVKNQSGTCIVSTNSANTKVKIIRTTKLSDGSEHRESWKGTTDDQGRVALEGVPIISKDELTIELIPENQQAVVEGLVLPDNLHDSEPFSFAAPGTVEGEVVKLQTTEGTVVQQGRADKYGRVFLAAGLPEGAYLVALAARDGQRAQPVGQIKVKQRPGDTLERPWEHPPQPMQIQNPPQAVKLSDPFSLTGHGFSPNYSDMQVTMTGSGKTEAPIVLAATEDQLKLAPVQQLLPGATELKVTNQATGQSSETQQLLLYNIRGELGRHTISSGHDQTQLVVIVEPENLALKVKATVASGPVDFGAGRKDAEAITSNGRAVFPVRAEHGSGPFQLTWELAPQTVVCSRCLDQDPDDLSGLTDAELVRWRQVLNRAKDQDYRDNGGSPGVWGKALWRRIKKIEEELRSRGLTIDSAGNVHTPSWYAGESLRPGQSYPPR